MTKTLRALHYLGLALFLGSVFTFIVVSSLARGAGLRELVLARHIISAGTNALTLPGIGLLLATGAWMSGRFGIGRHGWLTFKQSAMLLMVLNTIVLILPAARDCRALAEASLARGALLPEYHAAYLRESIAGGVNLVLALASMVVAVTRPRLRRARAAMMT